MTPARSIFECPEVLEVQDIPSVEVRMVPYVPVATNVLFAWVIAFKLRVTPEVLEVHVVPSGEERMVPSVPTPTNNPVVVNPLDVSYRLLKVFPDVSLTPVVTLIL